MSLIGVRIIILKLSIYYSWINKQKYLGSWESGFLLLEKEVTKKERKKARINAVILYLMEVSMWIYALKIYIYIGR